VIEHIAGHAYSASPAVAAPFKPLLAVIIATLGSITGSADATRLVAWPAMTSHHLERVDISDTAAEDWHSSTCGTTQAYIISPYVVVLMQRRDCNRW
jgi:hypothetical protein